MEYQWVQTHFLCGGQPQHVNALDSAVLKPTGVAQCVDDMLAINNTPTNESGREKHSNLITACLCVLDPFIHKRMWNVILTSYHITLYAGAVVTSQWYVL